MFTHIQLSASPVTKRSFRTLETPFDTGRSPLPHWVAIRSRYYPGLCSLLDESTNLHLCKAPITMINNCESCTGSVEGFWHSNASKTVYISGQKSECTNLRLSTFTQSPMFSSSASLDCFSLSCHVPSNHSPAFHGSSILLFIFSSSSQYMWWRSRQNLNRSTVDYICSRGLYHVCRGKTVTMPLQIPHATLKASVNVAYDALVSYSVCKVSCGAIVIMCYSAVGFVRRATLEATAWPSSPACNLVCDSVWVVHISILPDLTL